MAHQCLQCGRTFPDGSPELLRGCPQCEGTRFYYTQAPLAREEREALMAQANRDIKAILEELVRAKARPDYEQDVWSPAARERWLQVDADKLRAHAAGAVQEVAPPGPAPRARAPAPEARPHRTEQAQLPLVEERPQPTSDTPSLDDSRPREPRPEVVVVEEPGRYDIDVRQLLEKSPIVVRRDGVYVVHLPSVFAAAAKK